MVIMLIGIPKLKIAFKRNKIKIATIELISRAIGFCMKINSNNRTTRAIPTLPISSSMAAGIENAFMRIKKPLELAIIRTSFMIVSFFFIVWGGALFLDNFLVYRGLGFVIVGALVGIVVLLFLKEK